MNQSKKLFADRTFNDLVFEMKGGKKFPAHSCVITARCDALIPPKVKEALNNRKKNRQHAIPLNDERVTPVAFNALLEYLYTGVVRYQSLSQRELIETFIAAELFKVERLKFLCKQHFTEQLKMETLFSMMRDAHDYKCEALKNVAKKFAFDNYTTVISDKDGVKVLGVDLFQDIVSGYAMRDAKSPRGDEGEPAESITNDYKQIYERMLYPDASAVTLKNEKLAFHRALLAVHSDAFVQMFGKNDEPSAGWDFRSLSADAFRAMQRYLYYGETEIAPLHACELVAFAREHQLGELVKLCKHILQHNVNSQTTIEILKKCCIPGLEGYQEVNQNAIDYASTHLAELDLSELRNLDPKQGHHIACELLLRYQSSKKGGGGGAGGSSAHLPTTAAPASSSSAAPASPAPAIASSNSHVKKDKKK